MNDHAMESRVVLREFSSRAAAEVVREVLQANEIEAFVVSDDCGAVDPALQCGRGVYLLVQSGDFARAKQVLADSLRESATDET